MNMKKRTLKAYRTKHYIRPLHRWRFDFEFQIELNEITSQSVCVYQVYVEQLYRKKMTDEEVELVIADERYPEIERRTWFDDQFFTTLEEAQEFYRAKAMWGTHTFEEGWEWNG